MTDYFPTDVKLHLEGDKTAAMDLIGEARNLFYKATLQHGTNTNAPTQLVRYLPDGGVISVLLIDQQKIVTILSPPKPVPLEPKQGEEHNFDILYVLCGIEKGATTVTIMGKDYLRSFKPTPSTAKAHNVTNAYHDNLRLATTDNQTKAGMYTSAMKRVVAAVEGLGKIKDSSPQYLTPEPTVRVVLNKYLATYATTHGIYKAGPKNHWLIEISAARGVLAMPLPLIRSTVGKVYESYVRRIGDLGGLALCLEFGGLPSGETFPTGTALTTAITKGKVLQLLTASDLDPYYKAVTGETHTYLDSWAFAETRPDIHNVRFNFKKLPGNRLFSMSGEHWKITLSLSKHNLSAVFPKPVGVGSAVLSMEHTGLISKDALRNLWVAGADERLSPPLFTYGTISMRSIDNYGYGSPKWNNEYENPANILQELTEFGCYVRIFFDGDRMERVKYTPMAYLSPSVISIAAIVSDRADTRLTSAAGSPLPYSIFPGYCREGFISVRTVNGQFINGAYVNPYQGTFARGVFTGIGAIDMPVDPAAYYYPFRPNPGFPVFFGAVINPGRNYAYVMTKWIATQPALMGLPSVSPGYVTAGLLSNTEPITLAETTFIGNY